MALTFADEVVGGRWTTAKANALYRAVEGLSAVALPSQFLVVGPESAYATPAAAMADAESGDTILVMPGTYSVSELLVKTGVNIAGVDRRACIFDNPDDHTATLVPAGNNTISNLSVKAYPGIDFTGSGAGTSYGTGESTAIGFYDTVTPVVIESCDIHCGTDGIYTYSGHEITGNGMVIVRDCEFFNMTWDMLRVDCSNSNSPIIVIQGNRFIGATVANGTSVANILIRANPGIGIAYIDSNIANVSHASTGTYTTPASLVCIDTTTSMGAGKIRSSNNYFRVVATASQEIHGINYRVGGSTLADFKSYGDVFELSSGGNVYDFYIVSAGTAGSYTSTTYSGGPFESKRSTIASVGVWDPIKFQPAIYLRENSRAFTVAAQQFNGMNWTNAGGSSGSVNRSLRNQFTNYTYRAGDALVITAAGSNITVPATGTITAKGSNSSITAGVTSTGNVADNSITGHFLVRDVHCGLGDTAVMAMDEDFTVHVSGTQVAGQRLTMIFTGHASSNYTVTFGENVQVSSSTLAVNATTTKVVTFVSNGTTFIETSRA